MKKTQFKGVVMLLLAGFVWGSSFVAQSVGMESIETLTFNGIRMLLGAAILLPVIAINEIKRSKLSPVPKEVKRAENKKILINGTILGVILTVGSNLQQHAFNWTTPGKIAFITAFYMLFVPLFGLFFKKKTPLYTWICVGAGCVGLYFLCIAGKGVSGLNKGDIFAFLCSIGYAFHIIAIEKLACDIDSIKVSCTQFAVAGIISCIGMFILENPSVEAIKTAIIPIMYAGFLSSGVAFTLQIVGQKYTDSTVASLLMCTESLFGVICSAIILKERMTRFELLGCVIMFAAVVATQLNFKTLITKKKEKRAKKRA